MAKTGKPRLFGFLKGGYSFAIGGGTGNIQVMNMKTMVKVHYTKPANVVNMYDLRIWADGWIAGHNKDGWGSIV